MMQFVRTGPELIFMSSENKEALNTFLLSKHDAIEYKEQNLEKPLKFNILFDQFRDNSTLLFLSEDSQVAMENHIFEKVYITQSDISQIMLGMLNHSEKLVTIIQRSARVLFLKTVGDIERVIERVAEDFDGQIVDSQALYNLSSTGVIIHFTPENIDKTLHFNDIFPKAVRVEGDGRETYLELNKRAIRYVNVGMRNKFWYELDIKIYDSYGHYECHYDRLQYVLNKLDIGVLAGETWGTDAAMAFWSVDTYNLRMFTYLEPEAFKKVLLGLEYAGDGERKVDFDLYYRKRKVSWTHVRGKRKVKRDELGMECRQYIYDQLDEADKTYLRNLEIQIKTSNK